MDPQDIYAAIVADIKKQSNPEAATIDKRYHKYDGYNSYGLKAPVLDRIHRLHKTVLRELSCEDTRSLATRFYASHKEEEVLTGNYILALHTDCLALPEQNTYLNQISDKLMSWSTTDDFTGTIIQPLLLQQPAATLKLLRKWNISSNIWQQRTSVVAFTRKIGESGNFTSEALEFCQNLIASSEDLVQKAVGWALKDVMRGDKQRVLEYVKKLRKNGAPATITLYAIRDLKDKERAEVLSISKGV